MNNESARSDVLAPLEIKWVNRFGPLLSMEKTDFYLTCHPPPPSTLPGSAAEAAEKRKHKIYEFRKDDYIFVPVAQKTTGVWAGTRTQINSEDRTTNIREDLGKKINELLLHRMSITFTMQRGNLASVLGTLPAEKELDEILVPS